MPLQPLVALSLGFMFVALALEPVESTPYVVLWHCLLGASAAAATNVPAPVTLLTAASALLVPLFCESTNAVRCMHGMAWITHFLRLVRVVEHSSYFSRTSPSFRFAYVHFFHDLTLLQEARPGALLALLATTGAAGGCAALANTGLALLPHAGGNLAAATRTGLLLRRPVCSLCVALHIALGGEDFPRNVAQQPRGKRSFRVESPVTSSILY